MSRMASRLAWSSWALTATLIAGAGVLAAIDISTLGGAGRTAALSPVGIAWIGSFVTVGAIVASRRPSNPIGWAFCSMGVVIALVVFADQWAVRGLIAAPGSLPWARVAAWFQYWAVWLVFPSVLIVLVLLFPDGKLLSRRWGLVLGAAGVLTLALVVSGLVDARPIESWVRQKPLHTSNPTGVPALRPVSSWILDSAWLRLAVAVVAAAAPIVRLRRARGAERQQILWFAYAGVLLMAMATVNVVGRRFGAGYWVDYLLAVGMTALPVATGIAILKFRLYDIGHIINRTLVYGLLTVLLGGVYAGLAVAVGSAGVSNNSLVIAGLTLVVAALVRPARRRIQDFIDRRFYRRKYDAAKTLEAFSARLRNEVDLDDLREHLVGVVQETMQPAQASLWLREASR